MKLYIVRHGETHENIKGIAQGHSHGRLTALGRKQAKLLAELLEVVNFNIIYSSDLRRAVDTTMYIKKFQDCKVIYTKQLRERNLGIFNGKKSELFRVYYQALVARHPHTLHRNVRPPRGESYEQLQKRAIKFLDHVYHTHRSDTVLFVTHGGIKKVLLMYLEKIPWEQFSLYTRFDNCSLSVVEFTERTRHRVTLLNHVKHLAPLTTTTKQ